MMSKDKLSTPAEGYSAVIFDMDGTLIDSIQTDFLAWQKLFSDYGRKLDFSDYVPLLGIRSFSVAQNHLPIKNEEELRDALARKLDYFRELVVSRGIQAIPHAGDFIRHLKTLSIPLALATSSRREKMKMVMEGTGLLQFFNVIVAGEDVVEGKPAPEIFLKAASLLGVPPEGCIVFEDAVNGITAAKRASMKCIALSSDITSGLLGEADLVIEGFKDLDFFQLCHRLQ